MNVKVYAFNRNKVIELEQLQKRNLSFAGGSGQNAAWMWLKCLLPSIPPSYKCRWCWIGGNNNGWDLAWYCSRTCFINQPLDSIQITNELCRAVHGWKEAQLSRLLAQTVTNNPSMHRVLKGCYSKLLCDVNSSTQRRLHITTVLKSNRRNDPVHSKKYQNKYYDR